MAERLSSASTFLFKFVFTTVWPAGFALGSLLAYTRPQLRAQGTHIQFLLILVVGGLILWKFCAGLKRVDVDGDALVLSNYRRQIRVPLTEIAGVHQNRLLSIRPITVTFKHPTEFGRSIAFMPPFTFNIVSEDPIAGRLRELAVGK